mmetsp:Transcript_32228/g.94204  ORF Transcript_32228/g.94204 Transcript_32228/m.94204 type:complete len:316 (-) Transcript_32228:98-1045(-)
MDGLSAANLAIWIDECLEDVGRPPTIAIRLRSPLLRGDRAPEAMTRVATLPAVGLDFERLLLGLRHDLLAHPDLPAGDGARPCPPSAPVFAFLRPSPRAQHFAIRWLRRRNDLRRRRRRSRSSCGGVASRWLPHFLVLTPLLMYGGVIAGIDILDLLHMPLDLRSDARAVGVLHTLPCLLVALAQCGVLAHAASVVTRLHRSFPFAFRRSFALACSAGRCPAALVNKALCPSAVVRSPLAHGKPAARRAIRNLYEVLRLRHYRCGAGVVVESLRNLGRLHIPQDEHWRHAGCRRWSGRQTVGFFDLTAARTSELG